MILIQRLEQLTGPDREVDAEIFRLILGGKRPQAFWNFKGCQPRGVDENELWLEWTAKRAPSYTASIDAVMSLGRNEEERLLILVAVVQAAKAGKSDAQWLAAGIAEALHLRGIK